MTELSTHGFWKGELYFDILHFRQRKKQQRTENHEKITQHAELISEERHNIFAMSLHAGLSEFFFSK